MTLMSHAKSKVFNVGYR